jgi:hypothetical protein
VIARGFGCASGVGPRSHAAPHVAVHGCIHGAALRLSSDDRPARDPVFPDDLRRWFGPKMLRLSAELAVHPPLRGCCPGYRSVSADTTRQSATVCFLEPERTVRWPYVALRRSSPGRALRQTDHRRWARRRSTLCRRYVNGLFDHSSHSRHRPEFAARERQR